MAKLQKQLMKDVKEAIKEMKYFMKEEGEWRDDQTFHIIYNDKTSICSDEVTDYRQIKLTNIAYAAYMDGYDNMDTLGGRFNNCDNYWDHVEKCFC